MNIVRFLTWLVRLFLFVVLLLFALKNTMPVRLHFLFDTGWDVPLIVLLLVFFAAGAVLGVMACAGGLIRQRRSIGSLKRELEERRATVRPTVAVPPVPPDPGI
jgi:lipopolysaccharide assembly protein A